MEHWLQPTRFVMFAQRVGVIGNCRLNRSHSSCNIKRAVAHGSLALTFENAFIDLLQRRSLSALLPGSFKQHYIAGVVEADMAIDDAHGLAAIGIA
jgi:hypothetical protein